jgi:hypothetical protein
VTTDTITDVGQLMDHVNALWPRLKFTPEQVANRLYRFREHSLAAIVDAVTAWDTAHPDDRRPNWNQIGGLLAKQCRRKFRRDRCFFHRHWFSVSPKDQDPPAYADELIEVDAGSPLDENAWENWYAAAQAVQVFQFYHGPYTWAADAERENREHRLRVAHLRVRGLEFFGGQTQQRKTRWLQYLEQEFALGQLNPDDRAPTGAEIPF